MANSWQSFRHWLSSLWKFSRPHTVIGTSLSVLGLALLAVAEQQNSILVSAEWLPLIGVIGGTLISCLAGNIYIVGLNQLEDVAIDRINKPRLPLASGAFTQQQGQFIVGATGALALVTAALQGRWLLATVGLSLIIGTAYSLPPIRLKRFPFWAALCILTVRGAIVNLGLFLHFHTWLGSGISLPISLWMLTLFVVTFTLGIALGKDMPDIEGDRQYRISTLTLKLGLPKVFNLVRWVLTASYLGMVIAGVVLLQPPGWWIAGIHLILLASFWWRSRRVNLADRSAIAQFYQFIWKLFFLEYLLFPAMYGLR